MQNVSRQQKWHRLRLSVIDTLRGVFPESVPKTGHRMKKTIDETYFTSYNMWICTDTQIL